MTLYWAVNIGLILLLNGSFVFSGACQTPFQFECEAGQCIPTFWVCDGEIDCPNGHDELNCATPDICSSNQFRCNSGKCIAISLKCNGMDDCCDNSDEENCTEGGVSTCRPYQFQCNSGVCILNKWRCDGESDCADGEDEGDCYDDDVQLNCTEEEFVCQIDDKCLPLSFKCNRNADCSDMSDEIDCGSRTCSSMEHRCIVTGYCIYKEWLCDGNNDCIDGSDEQNCTSVSGRSVGGVPSVEAVIDDGCLSFNQFMIRDILDCPQGFEQFGNYCLYIQIYPVSWDAAALVCKNKSAELAVFPQKCILTSYMKEYLELKDIGGWNYWIGTPTSEDHSTFQSAKEVTIPSWYLNQRMCNRWGLNTETRECYFLDSTDLAAHRALSCDEYAGFICNIL